MGQPVAHDGQDLVGVGHLAADDEAAIFELFFDDLCADEFAALKVACCFFGHFDDDFAFLGVEPDAVFVLQGLQHVGIGHKVLALRQQAADLAKGKRFEPRVVHSGQVPNTAVVDQFVGLHGFVQLGRLGLATQGFGVFKADGLVRQDGLLQGFEQGLFATVVFKLVTFDKPGAVHTAVEQVFEKVGAERRKQVLHPGQAGKAFEVFEAELAQVTGFEVVVAFGFLQGQESQAFVQVALHSALGHAKLFGKCRGVELVALVELAQDAGEPVGQLVVFFHLKILVSKFVKQCTN